MRISDRHLIQRVDRQFVIRDESAGTEITIPTEAGPAIRRAIDVLGDSLTIDEHREDLYVAMAVLKVALAQACPGPHDYRQHRDRQPPWCEACRRTRDGRVIKEVGHG